MNGPRATTTRTSPARLVLAAFCVSLFIFAITRTGRSTESVDVRTYVEMTRSVALHGLPYFDNGPVDRFIQLRSPFNLYTHGHLWGIYAPAYAYFAALPFRLGGFRLASIATALLLIPIALVTYRLAKRLIEEEWYAVAAAILVVVSTPVLGKSLELSAYPLAMLFAVSGTATTLEAVMASGRKRLAYAFASGALFAVGSATHTLLLPMSLALVGALAVCDATSPASISWLERTPLRGLGPTRSTIASACVAMLGLVLFTVPVSLLNKVRFDSYNPFSYGPTPWHGMNYLAAQDQTISAHLKSAMPVLVLVTAVLLAWIVVGIIGKNVKALALGRGILLLAAAGAVAASPFLRDKVWLYAKCLYAFTVDQSLVDLTGPYRRVPGTFGNLHGPWATKSPIQCTPLILLGLFAPTRDLRLKQKVTVVLLPCVALFAYLMMRGNLPLYSALGVPWVYIRYTLPALPMLICGGMLVAREVVMTKREWMVAAAVGIPFAALLFLQNNDEPLTRQILVLLLPVVAAVETAILLLLFRWQKIGRGSVATSLAVVCGIGIGIAVGHDLRGHLDGKEYCDRRADAMRRATPQRFAMFGYHPTLAPVVGVTMERDVQYADMAEGPDELDGWQHMRPLVEYWFAEKRPVYMVADNLAVKPPWPDVVMEPVDVAEQIYLIKPKE